MFKSHEKFHAANGKRQILIVDDESVNRELLGHILEEDYEPLYACDGLETLELMRRHGQTLSMVLLDLMMPGMNGIELLRVKRRTPPSRRSPLSSSPPTTRRRRSASPSAPSILSPSPTPSRT